VSGGWKVEFPDMPEDLFPDLPEGWMDESWHNDVCPRFVVVDVVSDVLAVWVDYPAPEEREFPSLPRFRAYVEGTDGESCKTVVETDRWEDLLRAVDVKAREMLAEEYEFLIGYNPFEDDPAATVASVAQTLREYKAEAGAAS
jgi:hypothetical protein